MDVYAIRKKSCIVVLCFLILPALSFSQAGNFSLAQACKILPRLIGKVEKRNYPYVTAGQRLYAIGDQSGLFTPIGFHVEGEMGGVWQQPIKLLDGFRASLQDTVNKTVYELNTCNEFITYPFASSFKYKLANGLNITRTQFVPDDLPVLVVEFEFTNDGIADRSITLNFDADVNLMPVWLGERSGMIDSTDEFIGFKQDIAFFKDKRNTWFAGITSDCAGLKFSELKKTNYKGKGITGVLTTNLHIAKGKATSVRFFIAGSVMDTTEIVSNLSFAQKNIADLFTAKQKRYVQLENTASVNIPDKQLMQAYQWGKYASDWLMRDVPGLGKGMSAGLPDYPWFFSNDQAYTFNALLGTIQPDIFYQSWKMLEAISDKTNSASGRIIHEASTNGVAYDKGRMEESQLHIITAWNIYKWTGNVEFLKKQYVLGEKIWQWLETNDKDGNGYIEGYGGVEIEGLNDEMLDVQVYTQRFLEVMGKISEVLHNPDAAKMYHEKAGRLKKKINEDWWVPEDSRYADFISSKEKAVVIIDAALSKRVHADRNQWAEQQLTQLKKQILNGNYQNKGYNVYYNTSGILPLEEGIADTTKAKAVLKKIDFFTNKFGLYITGIERPDDTSVDEGNFQHDKEFNYNRAVMPAATTNLAIAACKYGNPDIALKYVHNVLNSFSYATPGTTYEVSPDYGMFVQAWNIRAYNIPLIHFFFGIDPTAFNKSIDIKPAMPAEWSYAAIKKVLIGDNKLSIDFKKENGTHIYTILSQQPGWNIKFTLPAKVSGLTLNGKAIKPVSSIILKGNRNIISFNQE